MQKIVQKHKWLGSVADPNKVSMTISGGVRFLVAIAALNGVDIDGTQIETWLLSVWAGLEACRSLYGLGRKAVYWFENKI